MQVVCLGDDGLDRTEAVRAIDGLFAPPGALPPLGLPAADSLESGFAQPPDSTKPWCYWYWITDNISREGITKDLEAMKRVGISQAYIGNIYLDEVKHGTVKALTEEWWGMVEHAIREGGRLGVDIGMFNCPGWSQSGGPWIKPEQAMRYVVSTERRIKGPAQFAEKPLLAQGKAPLLLGDKQEPQELQAPQSEPARGSKRPSAAGELR